MKAASRDLGVLVVENHWVWADAVEHQIAAMPGVRSAGVASTIAQALTICAAQEPRVALVDLLLDEDSGLRVARAIRSRHPAVRIVIVTVEPSTRAVAEAREIGLAGFVCKDDLVTGRQIQTLIASLIRGEEVFSATVIDLESTSVAGAAHGLNDDDLELIRCFSRGLGTAEISRLLCVAPQTLRNRTSRIGKVLGVSGRLEIVVKAYEKGVIAPPASEGPR